jgi:hypothetical protein
VRDTYVMWIFTMLIACATFLAWARIVDGTITILPIITGFLGLLAKLDRPIQPSVPLLERWGITKPPKPLKPLTTDPPKDGDES